MLLDILVICFIIIYFIPTYIAYRYEHKNAKAIFVLNLLLGWTWIGWVVALIWALLK